MNCKNVSSDLKSWEGVGCFLLILYHWACQRMACQWLERPLKKKPLQVGKGCEHEPWGTFKRPLCLQLMPRDSLCFSCHRNLKGIFSTM